VSNEAKAENVLDDGTGKKVILAEKYVKHAPQYKVTKWPTTASIYGPGKFYSQMMTGLAQQQAIELAIKWR
jgi:hypothetical protein